MIFWGEGVEERMIGVVKKSPANAPGKIKAAGMWRHARWQHKMVNYCQTIPSTALCEIRS